MKMNLRKMIAAALIAAVGFTGCQLTGDVEASAHTAKHARWNWYELSDGKPSIVRVNIKAACISAEDSAAHLKLIGYGNGTAIYGCERSGY